MDNKTKKNLVTAVLVIVLFGVFVWVLSAVASALSAQQDAADQKQREMDTAVGDGRTLSFPDQAGTRTEKGNGGRGVSPRAKGAPPPAVALSTGGGEPYAAREGGRKKWSMPDSTTAPIATANQSGSSSSAANALRKITK